MTASRIVYEQDAIAWLQQNELARGSAVVTSLPNVDEFAHRDFDRWRTWFVDAAQLVLDRTPPESAAIFFQTDIQFDGTWVDKSFLVQQAAARTDCALLWHKMALRAPVGTTTYQRPGYAHLLCFSKSLRTGKDNATADVMPQVGDKDWPRAMGHDIARFAVTWLRDHAAASTIVAPFCGTGTVLGIANELGLAAVGIERSTTRAAKARES